MPVVIDDSLLKAAHLDEQEFMREVAVALFAQDRLTLAQASKVAGMRYMDFQALLADREISVHYGLEDLDQDLRTLEQLRLTFPRTCDTASD